jgi:GNAT superfamily N-acetyltransferase
MPTKKHSKRQLTFKPVTPEVWPDFELLFEEPGIQDGCWCMYWRIRRADCQRQYGAGNKQAFKAIVESGQVPGILAYLNEKPIGWCAIAPRAATPVLDRSHTLKPVDDEPVWSITCFFVSKPYRRQGLTERLIQAAIAYAGERGAQMVEAYPLLNEITQRLPYERYMGIQSTFERVGFKEVVRRTDRRPIMRYVIHPEKKRGRS